MNAFRKAYSVVGVLLILEYLAQFYLMAMAIFTMAKGTDSQDAKVIYSNFKSADTIASLHVANGEIVIPLTTLLLIGLAIGSQYPRKTTALTALLLLLVGVQWLLVQVAIPLVTALHALNGIAIVATGSWLVWTHWAWRSRAVAPAAKPATVEELAEARS